MKKLSFQILLILLISVMYSCGNAPDKGNSEKESTISPDNNIVCDFWLEDGKPYYQVSFHQHAIVNKSALGFVLENDDVLSDNLQLIEVETNELDEYWEQVWGQQKIMRNHFNETVFSLQEKDGQEREFKVAFRVFNDGIGFRYIIPEQANLKNIVIMNELTEFAMAKDYDAWWIPAYEDNRYEYLFKNDPISTLDVVHTPFTMEKENEEALSIHEAALVNYAAMTLRKTGNTTLKCDLMPNSDGTLVKAETPLKTPWRTIQISDNAGGLITSGMILNLNEPNKLDDLSFVKPMKYLGIWWGMHIGKYSFWESDIHGATTENARKYIDYCKKFDIPYLLIEGWNKGWTPAWYENKLHVFSFTESTPDFDFEEVIKYADQQGVEIVGYHETGSNIENYLAQIDDGMAMYHNAGMESIKIGQVGSRLAMKEWHGSQYGVNYYETVLEKAREYQLNVNFHEPIKPTGLSRTYPHLMAGEGGRGQEYNAWSDGNPPEHTVILPFTRILGGPMDFTPGIFKIKGTRVHTTLAKQLALYLTMYSPIQMLADLPENYDGHPALQFLQDVPVNWDTTLVLNAKIGDYLTIVRKDIDSDDWYLGSITDENERNLKVSLSFLEANTNYLAHIYEDANDAEYDINPEAYSISDLVVNSTTNLNLKLAKGGGQAIRFTKMK